MKLNDAGLTIKNPDAQNDLILSVQLIAETDKEYAKEQFRENISKDYNWIQSVPENNEKAIVCGASPSLIDNIELIRNLKKEGYKIFSCNKSAQILESKGIISDYQVLLDPHHILTKEVCLPAKCHLIASVCNPEIFEAVQNPILWHPGMEWVMDELKDVKRNFDYIGGGVTVLNFAVCLMYTMGHRDITAFGIDSSYKTSFYADGQMLNTANGQLMIDIEHNHKSYKTTIDMKQQAVVFMKLADQLKTQGCKIKVYGDGLLPDLYNALESKA